MWSFFLLERAIQQIKLKELVSWMKLNVIWNDLDAVADIFPGYYYRCAASLSNCTDLSGNSSKKIYSVLLSPG